MVAQTDSDPSGARGRQGRWRFPNNYPSGQADNSSVLSGVPRVNVQGGVAIKAYRRNSDNRVALSSDVGGGRRR